MQNIYKTKIGISNSIAKQLTNQNVDVNELSKCVGFLRDNHDGTLFFDYLDAIIADGRTVIRSGLTLGYYRDIRDACRKHLMPYQDDPETMAWILGWAARLMRYYAVADRLDKPIQHSPKKIEPHAGPTGDRHSGRVKWFNKNKGYGFIEPDEGGKDLFVHISQTPEGKGLQEQQLVSFVIGKDSKGRAQAQKVKLL